MKWVEIQLGPEECLEKSLQTKELLKEFQTQFLNLIEIT